jgi:hypothetical protein
MSASRRLLLHAGAVALNNAGLLLPGESKSGKSTLTLALLLRGCQYSSDEIVILDGTSLELLPSHNSLTLRSDVFSLFSEFIPVLRRPASGSVPATEDHGEARLAPQTISTGGFQRCLVRYIIFPRYVLNESVVIEPVRRSTAVLDMLRCCFDAGREVAATIAQLIAVARHADTYSLRYGNAHEAAKRLIELIESSAAVGR